MLNSVVQEETTGCGIAAVANILGKSYAEMKAKTSGTGLYSSVEMGAPAFWTRPATCHPISGRISMLCSPSGLSRSNLHNKALSPPLSRPLRHTPYTCCSHLVVESYQRVLPSKLSGCNLSNYPAKIIPDSSAPSREWRVSMRE